MPSGVGGGLGTVGGAGLGEDVGDMPLRCPTAQDQFPGNLSTALARCDEAQHLHLSLGQTVWISRGDSRTASAGMRHKLFLQGLDSFHQGSHAQFSSDAQAFIQQR